MLRNAAKLTLLLGLAAFAGCSVESGSGTNAGGGSGSGTSGTQSVVINGSSTVAPISTLVAEKFRESHPEIQVSVGTSGTGGGFKKFIAGESDINDASRPIKDSEREACAENGIEFIELKVAIDGISVVVHNENDFVSAVTVAQLKKIWEPESTVKTWKDVDASWPDEEIKLYGPDADSGTFDYFTDVVNGEEGSSRTEYSPSANDNDLVLGVSNDRYALGYFGYAYYIENKDRLKAVGVSASDDVADAVAPTQETIEGGQYAPLSRPLFIYVRKDSLKRPEVAEFVKFYLNEGVAAVGEVGYVPLNQADQDESRAALEAALAE